MDLIENKIKNFVGALNYAKGRNYFIYYVRLISEKNTKGEEGTQYIFRVDSEHGPQTYTVRVRIADKNIVDATCTCPQFDIEGCCKHVAACLYHNKDELFPMSDEEKKLLASRAILEEMYSRRKVPKVGLKRQVHLDVELNFYQRKNWCSLSLQIGEDKMYSLSSKLPGFIRAYKNRESLKFGKNFSYNPEEHFFSKKDEEIIKYLIDFEKKSYYSLRTVNLEQDDIKEFLNVVKDRPFKVNGLEVINVQEGCPITLDLKKDEELYVLKTDLQKLKKNILDSDCRFAYDRGTFYLIPDDFSDIIYNLMKNDLDELSFKRDNLEMFTQGMLPVIKENVSLDDSLKDEVILGVKPEPKIYLDLKNGLIIANVKFSYNDIEVDFFEENGTVVRDEEIEHETVMELLSYGFKESDKSFYLDDFDEIGDFLENHIDELAEKYAVFSSKKIQNTSFLKDNHIRSTFSIGKDNILRYEFDFGEISNEEMADVLDTLKRKKKYYKLKSGNILNLSENPDLDELERLVEAMDMDSSDLKEASGEIPKYRAVYLDSLKKDKYHIISTDNLFDELISKFNSYKDAKVKLSKKDKETLRDYQEIGVKWLYNIYKCGFGGILADEMGLGKSIQLICLIKEILKEKKDAKILIVAPTSLIYNWKNEFDKFGSEIKYKVFAENKDARKHDLENIQDINVLITTYGLVRRDKELYDEIYFELIAIDEAQNIKNANAQMTKAVKSLKANTKLALTGTPLENSVLELWSIFDFIMPGYLANLLSFQRRYNVKDVDEEHMKSLDNLTKQISPFILRRKKKDVIKELPDKIENNIYIDLNDEQKKLYAVELEKTKKEIDEVIAKEGFQKGNFKILQLLMRLRQLCIDPSIVYENYKGGSSKIENLVSIVEGIIKNGHKILLFTSFKTALDIVNREFTNNRISTYVIDGSVPSKKRMELVDKFNSDDTNVFLITLKSGGTGLNLTSADVVIHLDLWWNPQVENQATDRAHRIGQKNTVEVIKLICKGTIEERILELQNKKKLLSDKLIEGENRDQNIISKLSEEDIKNLLSLDNEE